MSTVSQPLTSPRSSIAVLLRDYAELVKARVTTLIVMTAWCGYYFGAMKSGVSSLSWTLVHALFGIGLVAGGTAALNEVMETDLDALMRRTADRPLVTGRMTLTQGIIVGLLMTAGGSAYLAITTNLLAGLLTFATSVVYLAVYTPLKRLSPICTSVGALPGAMPPLLGWVAIRGRVELEAVVLFAIVLFWQFPHFHSIAWLYREDYERAHIRMLPVVDATGRMAAREIVIYSLALLPAVLAPTIFGMSGRVYLIGALLLTIAFAVFGIRLALSKVPIDSGLSKQLARRVLLASVFYLPLLFGLMMLNTAA
jgi:protoheme IX farnesyltransferase